MIGMGNARIIPFKMSAPVATRHVRELAKDSSNVYFLRHAEKVLKKRRITHHQAVMCLRLGKIVEGPYIDNGSGNWRFRMERLCCGEEVTLAVELENTEENGVYKLILVVTAF